MSLDLRVLGRVDLEQVYDLGRKLHEFRGGDIFASWVAPWRKESLEHYLATGWCLGVFQQGQKETCVGFCLAQPMLFWRRQTQSVWCEFVEAQTAESALMLAETIVRIGRDKHMQRVLFANDFGHTSPGRPDWIEVCRTQLSERFASAVKKSDDQMVWFEVKTTKDSD